MPALLCLACNRKAEESTVGDGNRLVHTQVDRNLGCLSLCRNLNCLLHLDGDMPAQAVEAHGGVLYNTFEALRHACLDPAKLRKPYTPTVDFHALGPADSWSSAGAPLEIGILCPALEEVDIGAIELEEGLLKSLGRNKPNPWEDRLHWRQLGGLVVVADPHSPLAGPECIPALGEHPVPKEPQGMAPGEKRRGLRQLRLELEAICLEANGLCFYWSNHAWKGIAPRKKCRLQPELSFGLCYQISKKSHYCTRSRFPWQGVF